MNNEIYQKVFDTIQPVLPIGWKKMILYVGYSTDSYSMKFYISNTQNVFTDCFSMKGTNKALLIKTFMNIDKLLAPERRALSGKDRWSVMTLIVDSNGRMETYFDYTDISENSIEYERVWKEKFVK